MRPTHALSIAALSAWLVLAAPTNAQLTQNQRKAIDRACARFDSPDTPGVAVAVIRRGEIVFEKGYGSAQLEYSQPIRPETIFHVASVTKQFTAFALVLLAAEGKLSLDDDVRKHVPWIHDFGHKISIRHLLNHTSGLRDQWELLVLSGLRMDDVLTQRHILDILRHQRELNFAPGSRYLYSNMGYTLAAHIVAEVAGESFAGFCARRIFTPLGMTRTHMHQRHRRIVKGRAYSYVRTPLGFDKGALSYANAGATSLFTTAGDLARWLHNFASGKVGGKAAIDELFTRGILTNGERIPYALGVVHGAHGQQKTIGHSGADAGFRSNVLWLPKPQLGIVVLSNVADANPQRVARAIANTILPKGEGTPRRNNRPKRERRKAKPVAKADPQVVLANLRELTGRYYCPELESFFEILLDGTQVLAQHRRHGKLPLRWTAKDRLTGRSWYFRRLEFTRKNAKITGFRLSGSRVLNLRFVRAQ